MTYEVVMTDQAGRDVDKQLANSENEKQKAGRSKRTGNGDSEYGSI